MSEKTDEGSEGEDGRADDVGEGAQDNSDRPEDARLGGLQDEDDLLGDLQDEDARAARRELIEQLTAEGISREEIANAVAEDRLALLPVEHELRGELRYTFEELAQRAELPEDQVARHMLALGLPQPTGDNRLYNDEDVEMARLVGQFEQAGLPNDGMLQVSRVLGQSMANIAAAISDLAGNALLQPGDNERDLALRYRTAARELIPLLEPLIGRQLRLHMLEVVRRVVVSSAERESGQTAGTRPVAIAFADLVSFTRLGERLAPAELGAIATRLAEMAGDLATPPVRLVKTIGDAAMLASYEAAPLLDAVLELIAAVDAEGEDFPQICAGIAHGPALPRSGDFYGRPVNLASRITGVARPGSVLASNDLQEAVGDDEGERYRWSQAGRYQLKGFENRVPLMRVRRQEPEEAETAPSEGPSSDE